MGKNNVKVTGFRIEDEDVLAKMGIIAEKHCRTRNKEVEFALKLYVADYEHQNGVIDLDMLPKDTRKVADMKTGDRKSLPHERHTEI